MLTLHLIRHAQTDEAKRGIFCGDIDPPISPEGELQARRLVPALVARNITHLYVSPRRRAQMTAAPFVAKSSIVREVLEDLREMSYGTWEGRLDSDVRASEPERFDAWTRDPSSVSPPGGESGYQLADRITQLWLNIRQRRAHGDVVGMVTHKAIVRVLTCVLLEIPLARFRDRLDVAPCSITTFAFGESGPMLRCFGETGHLAPQ